MLCRGPDVYYSHDPILSKTLYTSARHTFLLGRFARNTCRVLLFVVVLFIYFIVFDTCLLELYNLLKQGPR